MPPKNGLKKFNPAYYVSKQKFDTALTSAKGSAKRANAKLKEYKAPAYALGNSALVLAGAGLGGVTRAYQPSIGALPTDIALSLVLITAGVTMKKTSLVYLGSGLATAFVGGYVQDMSEQFFYGTSTTAVPIPSTGTM